ncbi:jg21230 [Pararge aegeria aegeria]|uniref:Jg21230 protein n=1 Tax=Pararge aegeria aegeria TaxID=348720 RepID=A0A8S4R553_9NEOP|nr:jg21230 [Pararge aegeria aegeria]
MSCLVLGVSGSLVSAMSTAAAHILIRSIEGIGTGGAIITSYVLCIEYSGVRYREIVTALFHIPLNIGHLTLPGISYLLRHCDEFQLAISIPVFFYVGMRWMVMESPKWLMDNDHIDETVVAMEKFASFTRIPKENIRQQIEEYHAIHSTKSQREIKIWHLFYHKTLISNFIYMSVIYFLCGMGYYGVSQYIGQMSGVELFPTSIRNSVLGILSVMSRVGQIVAPLINALPENISGVVFGVLALVGTFFCYLLPETKDIELPSSLDDTKVLSRRKSHLVEDLELNQNIATSSSQQ